jgi:hypothetical protein
LPNSWFSIEQLFQIEVLSISLEFDGAQRGVFEILANIGKMIPQHRLLGLPLLLLQSRDNAR